MLFRAQGGGDELGRKARSAKTVRRRASRSSRRNFVPHLGLLEERTLLATMVWNNSAGGDWDVASNWVNTTNPSDEHVPTSSDDAVIDLSGITVAHSSNTSDSVNSLTASSSDTTLSLSSGSLSLASASTLAGALTLSGGTLTGAGTLTVEAAINWTGGTMAGSGTTDADGGMTIGDPGSNVRMFLDQRTLNNAGDATFADAYPVYPYGLFMSSPRARIDNQPGAAFAFISDA